MKLSYKIILGIVGLALLIIFYFFFNPEGSAWAPKCPFWLLTGYYCPGCGSQRAIHCFLNGRIVEGIRYNYLLLPSLLYAVLLILSPKGSKLSNALTSSIACWILFSVFMLWWLIRNLIGV